MPLGIQRLNERTKRPNELINFIKPLPSRSSSSNNSDSETFLSRIAAQIYPIMRTHHLAVMSLEEFPANREFWGRNFNAGEVIQLVLKTADGQWLSERQVQMVMIHELAHCVEMNHSRAFWKVRNAFADELRALWARGYRGEGLWGVGRGLEDGHVCRGREMELGMPESLCGGVYRNRGKRRRAGLKKEELSWAEKKQRRILKKFGAGGMSLGGDEEARVQLEKGKKVKGKPRVAGSVRARELRAAAALARFGQAKSEDVKKEEDASETDDEYGEESEDHSVPTIKTENKELVRVCAGEDKDDIDVKKEFDEMMGDLWDLPDNKTSHVSLASQPTEEQKPIKTPGQSQASKHMFKEINKPGLSTAETHKATMISSVLPEASIPDTLSGRLPSSIEKPPVQLETTSPLKSSSKALPTSLTCEACSCSNLSTAPTCVACNNVLDLATIWDHWRCQSEACTGSVYVNLGDYGRCQICDARKPSS